MLGSLGRLIKLGDAQKVVLSLPSPMASGIYLMTGGVLCYIGLLGLNAAASHERMVTMSLDALLQGAKEAAREAARVAQTA